MYSADLLPVLQSLLSTLANIEIAHQSEVEAVRSSSVEKDLKQLLVREVQEHHRKRRESYARQLEVLREPISTIASGHRAK
jgi:hypothetical protein